MKQRILAKCPGALIRTRANSSRFAVLVRAAEGEPAKRSVSGPHGQLEALGAGQQVVAHGKHSSGALLDWEGGRGPDTVSRDQLPAVTEQQVDQLLTECASLLGSVSPGTAPAAISNVFEQPVATVSSILINPAAPTVNDLSAGIEVPKWFDGLSPAEKATLVRFCLEKIDNRTHDTRPRWLQILFAVADAGQRGCPNTRELALMWSEGGASWTGEADFDTAWDSYKPGATTVGSLLKMARDAGLDLSLWRDLALTRSHPGSGEAQALATPSGLVIDLTASHPSTPTTYPRIGNGHWARSLSGVDHGSCC